MTLKPSYSKYKSLKPPFPFAGAYTSTVLSKLRITLHRHKVQPLLKNSIQETYVSKSGLKLSVHVNCHDSSSKTLFVLPGYLSHHNTSYMQSSLEMFFNSGWNVIRINPVDHGDSLSLNKEVFNAHQHHEVAECIEHYIKEENRIEIGKRYKQNVFIFFISYTYHPHKSAAFVPILFLLIYNLKYIKQ